jgi:hypothetical protein
LAASGHSALNAMAKIASQTAIRRDFKDMLIYTSYPKKHPQYNAGHIAGGFAA